MGSSVSTNNTYVFINTNGQSAADTEAAVRRLAAQGEPGLTEEVIEEAVRKIHITVPKQPPYKNTSFPGKPVDPPIPDKNKGNIPSMRRDTQDNKPQQITLDKVQTSTPASDTNKSDIPQISVQTPLQPQNSNIQSLIKQEDNFNRNVQSFTADCAVANQIPYHQGHHQTSAQTQFILHQTQINLNIPPPLGNFNIPPPLGNLTFCPNARLGCNYSTPRGKTDDHPFECLFREVKCPKSGTCIWQGQLEFLRRHFFLEHPLDDGKVALEGMRIKLKIDWNNEDHDIYVLTMNSSHFILSFKVNVEGGTVLWTVQKYASKSAASKYVYRIEIFSAANHKRNIIMTNKCYSDLTPIHAIYNGGKHAVCSIAHAKTFVDWKENLNLRLAIFCMQNERSDERRFASTPARLGRLTGLECRQKHSIDNKCSK